MIETERARKEMLSQINLAAHLTDENVVKASQDLDQEIVKEMLAQDPVIENQYLKRLLQSKDEEIRRLQKELYVKSQRERRIKDLVEVTAMKYEAGMIAIDAIDMAVRQAKSEGVI